MVWLLAILAYLLGSLSFAVLLSRWFGTQDPRASGSGNPGATNMLRVAGKKLAILTLLGDVGKGLLPVLVARWLGLGVMEEAWVGIAAVIGHLYPLYFNFRGGKGVATAAGMLLGLYPPAVLLAAAAWLLTFKLSRTSSLASLVATSVWQEFGHMTKYQLRDYTHHHIGEWHDPHGSSRDIDPKDTFMALGQSEELAEIKARDLAERRRHGRKLSEFI